MLSGEISRKTEFEKGSKRFLLKTNEGYTQDLVFDDQTLIVNIAEGLIIIFGCSHAGVINTINYAIQQTNQQDIRTIIEGTHLRSATKETKEKSIQV